MAKADEMKKDFFSPVAPNAQSQTRPVQTRQPAQVGQRKTAQGWGFSKDWDRSGNEPKGMSSSARLQRRQNRRRDNYAQDRAITGMKQTGQTGRVAMREAGANQRQRSSFVQALQEQQSKFGQRNQEQQARFGQQNKLAGIQRQQTLQDQYASSLGMKPTDRAKIFADTQDMYDMQKRLFEAENKGTPFQSQADWLQSSGILHQENPRSDYLQSLMNPQQSQPEERPRGQGPGYRQLADGSYTNRGMDSLSNSVANLLTAQGVDLNKPLESGGGSHALFLNQQTPQMMTTQAEIDNADVAYRSQPLAELLTNPQQYGPQVLQRPSFDFTLKRGQEQNKGRFSNFLKRFLTNKSQRRNR